MTSLRTPPVAVCLNDAELSELVVLASGGDRPALNRIISEAFSAVRPSLQSKINASPRIRALISADDMLNESVEGIVAGLEGFEPEQGRTRFECFVALVNRISHNRLADFCRAQRAIKRGGAFRPQLLEGRGGDSGAGNGLLSRLIARTWCSPTRGARYEELVSLIHVALEKIRPNYRQVIEFKLFFGMENDQLAERLNTTEGNVRKLLSRAISELAEHMGDRCEYLSWEVRRDKSAGQQDEA